MEHTLLSRLPDAHCHPQDDRAQCVQGVTHDISASAVAVMGVRQGEDWRTVEQLYKASPHRVIPCFGVHPWCVLWRRWQLGVGDPLKLEA
jgi:Tat protein secretion system quality control protein TatD with DNase activity